MLQLIKELQAINLKDNILVEYKVGDKVTYKRLRNQGKPIPKIKENANYAEQLIHESPEDELLVYFRQAYRKIFQDPSYDNGLDADIRYDIRRMFDRFRLHLMDQDLSGFMQAYADESAKHPDAFDFFIDEVLAMAGVNDIDVLLRKTGIKEDKEE